MSAEIKVHTTPIEKYRCGGCGKIHDDEDSARKCCPVERIYYCALCKKEYGDYFSAVECCNTVEKYQENHKQIRSVEPLDYNMFDEFVTLKALADNEIESFRTYINEYFPYVVKDGNMLSLSIAFNRFSGKVT